MPTAVETGRTVSGLTVTRLYITEKKHSNPGNRPRAARWRVPAGRGDFRRDGKRRTQRSGARRMRRALEQLQRAVLRPESSHGHCILPRHR